MLHAESDVAVVFPLQVFSMQAAAVDPDPVHPRVNAAHVTSVPV